MDSLSLVHYYILLGVLPDSSDDEVRRAFHARMKECHPDLNPHRVGEATRESQQVIDAYDQITNARHPVQGSAETQQNTDAYAPFVRVRFRVPDSVDVSDIRSRKSAFREAWQRLQDNPSDVICALRLVHASFQAERHGSVTDLLFTPLVIDSAALLLSLLATEEALATLRRWAQFLVLSQRHEQAAQVLDDVFVTGKVPEIKEELRYLHYTCAVPPLGTRKPPPDVRISHLKRAMELGRDDDRVHKHLAEAYHELGDDRRARVHLETAFQINPALWGAVRISRALGMSRPTMPEPRREYVKPLHKYDRPDQLPSPEQIRVWEKQGAWTCILQYADLADYSWDLRSNPPPRSLVEIVRALGRWRDPRSVEALTKLVKIEFERPWQVWEAAVRSLAKVGDSKSMKLLCSLQPSSQGRTALLKANIEYLEARLAEERRPVIGREKEWLMRFGQEAFDRLQYGRARFFCEAALSQIGADDPAHTRSAILLARSCAEMHDYRTAIDLVRPILLHLDGELRDSLLQDLTEWLYDVCNDYSSEDDEDYLLALWGLEQLCVSATTADQVLKYIRRLSRWFEILGAADMAGYVRELIRLEAPGTWYVDKHDRLKYIRAVKVSERVQSQLANLDNGLRGPIASKLRHLMESEQPLGHGKPLLKAD